MTAIRYSGNLPGSRAFTPIPVGGGHATPASIHTSQFGYVAAQGLSTVPAPDPPLAAGRQGSQVGSLGGPQTIRPDRYVGVPASKPRVKFSPLQPPVTPVPAEGYRRLPTVAFRSPWVGGKTQSTPWPRVFPNYTRSGS
ncbi:MAG: hypothetical protein ACYCV4_05465 [Dermatophilaceae bacterium]